MKAQIVLRNSENSAYFVLCEKNNHYSIVKKMTIEHQTDPSILYKKNVMIVGITELGDNKVMKQNLDDAFISVCSN